MAVLASRPTAWRTGRIVVVTLLLALLLIRLWDPAWLRDARESSFDVAQRLQPRAAAPSDLVIVNIDNASLARHGQWPWPRRTVAQLVDAIALGQPKVIGFSILFAEPDRSSPAMMQAQSSDLPAAIRAALAQLPDGDAQLAAALERQPTVLGLAVSGPLASGALSYAREFAPSFVTAPELAAPLPRFEERLGNLPALSAASAGSGSVAVTPDRGVVRSVPLAVQAGDRIIPALAVELLRWQQDGAPLRLDGSATGLNALTGPGGRVATDAAGLVRIYFARPNARHTVSAASILDGSATSLLKGKTVLVSVGAAGLVDLFTTPLGVQMPGAEIHAQYFESLRSGQVLLRPWWAGLAEGSMLIAVTLAALQLRRDRPAYWIAGAFGSAALLWVAVSWLAFSHGRLLLDALFPTIALLGFAVILVGAHLQDARQTAEARFLARRRQLRSLQGELQRLSRTATIEQMASALAHELNQPLQAIGNFVQASRRLLPDADTGKVDGYLGKAAAEVGRAGSIIAGLRDLVRTGETQKQADDLNELVIEAVDAALLGQPEDAVQLHFALAEGLPQLVGNRIQLQQVVVNLVRNAVEAMQAQPATSRLLTISSLRQDDGDLVLRVDDSGPGLSPAVADKLFKPFNSSKASGMGVGLAICRKIIASHGGRLEAEPLRSGGMRFWFSLPARDQALST
jgi:signal transduction histidine kinase